MLFSESFQFPGFTATITYTGDSAYFRLECRRDNIIALSGSGHDRPLMINILADALPRNRATTETLDYLRLEMMTYGMTIHAA